MKNFLFMSFVINVLLMPKLLLAQGQSCENALELNQELNPIEVSFSEQQVTAYINFTALNEKLLFSLYEGTNSPFAELYQVEVYEKESCNNINLIYSKTNSTLSLPQEYEVDELGVSQNYLLIIKRDSKRELNEAHFTLKSYVPKRCPIYNSHCGELIKNGEVDDLNIVVPNTTVNTEFMNRVCEWQELTQSADWDPNHGNSIHMLYSHGECTSTSRSASAESVWQSVNTTAGKTYRIQLDIKKQNQLSPVSFNVVLLNQADINALPILTPPHRGYCDYYMNINNEEQVFNVPGSSISNTFNTFEYCFTPTANYDAIGFYPELDPNLQSPSPAKIWIDNISLKELKSVDLGPDISFCGDPVRIGPGCSYAGATYSWSPTTGLNNPNIANPLASPSSTTTYTLTVSYPGTPCATSSDDIEVSRGTGNVNFDYTMPANADVNWIVNNMQASAQNSHVFENYNIDLTGTLTVDDNITGNALVFKNCNFYCQAGSKIVVSTGEGLELDNTSFNNCTGDLWEGIELHGNNTLSQASQQPYLRLKNGTEITNAKVGVRTGLTNAGSFVANTGGGFIKSEGAIFRNNLVDIKFHPYINQSGGVIYKDLTEIYNTKFISDLPLQNSQITQNHVEMNGVDGIKFGGCTFDNQLLQSNLNDRGVGIEAVDASFSVSEHYASGSSVFKGLHTAIYSYTQNPLFAPYVRKSNFENNVKAISVNGNDAATVIQSTFDIPDVAASYGLYLNYANGYQIEENEFIYTDGVGNANHAVGVVIYGSNQTTNQLYNNFFNHLNTATLIEGNNRLPNNKGLEIKCNDYLYDDYHIALNTLSGPFGTLNPSIAEDQGSSQGQTGPAGNTFNYCTWGGAGDIYVPGGGSAFNYYHHTTQITNPNCITTAKITKLPGGSSFDKVSACPSDLGGSGSGGGPGPGPGLVDHRQKQQVAAKMRLSASSHKSGDSLTDSLINAYMRHLLMSDTVQLDSIIHYLQYSTNPNQQIRVVAAMARKGDTVFSSNKSLHRKLNPMAERFGQFQAEVKAAKGTIFSTAKADPEHAFYIWAKAVAKKQYGEGIPNPINLPPKRIKEAELEGNGSSEVNVYPSPADQSLFVEAEGVENTEIMLYNMQGRKVKQLQLKLQEKNYFSVADLANGVYLMRLSKADGNLVTKKITINH